VEDYHFVDLDRTINLGSNVPHSESFARVQNGSSGSVTLSSAVLLRTPT